MQVGPVASLSSVGQIALMFTGIFPLLTSQFDLLRLNIFLQRMESIAAPTGVLSKAGYIIQQTMTRR